MSKKIIASFLGINAYPQSPLSGCIKDVLGFDLFLRDHISQQQDTLYDPLYFLAPNKADEIRIKAHQTLIRQNEFAYEPATFKCITEKAFAHFKKAEAGDTCILYYSGHGSQADAPEEFWHTKPDRQNETIVCVDSRDPQSPGARDIIDKELAYLLWEALPNNVHCLLIMDCCHSGNNTRAVINNEEAGTRFRFIPSSRNKIPLQQYLGFDKDFYSIQDGKASIKIAKYVHLAAARDSEKALESGGGGLFSSRLLEVLRSGGTAKSYRDLMQGLAITVSSRASQQNPVAFARDDKDLDLQFLGTSMIPYQPSFEVRYDFNIQKWVMYGGLLHNIFPASGNAKTTVQVNGAATEIELVQVNNTNSFLDEAQAGSLDKDSAYRAVLSRLANPPIMVGISAGLMADPSLLQQLKEAFATTSHLFFDIDFEQQQPTDYLACLSQDNRFVLAKSDSLVPLFAGEETARNFIKNIDAFCKWQSVLDLKNTNTSFTKDDFVFTVEKVEGTDIKVPDKDSIKGEVKDIAPGDETVLHYTEKMQPAFRFSVKIKNPAVKSCYLGVLYLDSKFEINNSFSNNDNSRLVNNGQPLHLSWIDNEGGLRTLIPVNLDPAYLEFNISEITDFLKIFISTKPIELDQYKQAALSIRREADRIRMRGIGEEDIDADGDAADKTDWTVFTFPVRIVRSKKEAKLEAGRRAVFSSFEIEVPAGFSADSYAATGNDIQRKLSTKRGMDESDDGIEQFILPPAGIWGDVVSEPSPFSSGISASSDNGIKVLEIFPGHAATTLKEGQELLIVPKKEQMRAIGENETEETIIPYGYDDASQMYFPLGYTDENGTVHIQQLPSPTPGVIRGEAQLTRSVGSSIKLFFKKIFNRRKPTTLTLYELNNGEPWKKITENPVEMKTIFEKNTRVPVVLLIHGILGSMKDIVGSLMEVKEFSSVARFVLAYDYENLSTPIASSAQLLREDLSAAGFNAANKRPLSIVAHSMGGLLARCLTEQGEGAPFVTQLIFAGTPNAGSELGELKADIFGLITHALNVTGPIKYALTGLSFLLKKIEHDPNRTLDEMTPGSSFLTKLLVPGKPVNIVYSLIAGNTSLLKKGYDGDDFFLKNISAAFKTKLLYPGLSKFLFSSTPNDMAVRIDSMKSVSGLNEANMYVVANDHISYFSERESQQIILKLLGEKKQGAGKKEQAAGFDAVIKNSVPATRGGKKSLSPAAPSPRAAIKKAVRGGAGKKRGIGDEQPAASGTESTSPQSLSLYVNAYYQDTAVLEQEISIRVNLTKNKIAESSAAPIEAAVNSTVDIVADPKTGFKVIGPDMQSIVVLDEEESKYVNFKLKAISQGEGKIRLLVFIDGIELQHIDLFIQVSVNKPQDSDSKVESRGITSAPPSSLPDLTLLIQESDEDGKCMLTFRLTTSEGSGLEKKYLQQYGPVELKTSPQKYVQDFFTGIVNSSGTPAVILNKLEKKGMQLFNTLFPPDLRSFIWLSRDKIKTLKIDSDEPWIPWEICRLTGKEDNRMAEGQFFCEAFEITRWLPGHGAPRSRINLKKIAMVVPEDSGLTFAKKEKKKIQSMVKGRFSMDEIRADYMHVEDAFSQGLYNAWHFSGHGSFYDTTNAESSKIILENREFITPEIVNGTVENLGLAEPFIFLNACEAGKGAYGLTGVNSWASRFLSAGAVSFIGAYWAISDDMAYEFAIAFYERLLKGDSIGKAVKEARLAIKKPGDPTWLAYTVFADPAACLS